MIRAALALWLLLAGPLAAQGFAGLARIDPAASGIADAGEGVSVDLALSQPVPYRLFTLIDPMRLVIEFREVDFTGLIAADLLRTGRITDLTFATPRPGWSRLEATLADSLAVTQAGLAVDEGTGTARLTLQLNPVAPDRFAALAGAPDDPVRPDPTLSAPVPRDGPLVIAIDPGHGGVDPGALRGDVVEADLMLRLSIELAEAINRSGTLRAVLTREADVFVSLEDRMTIARAAGAGALISLHADALDDTVTRGASAYTLNAEGVDRAAQRMAERHERGDLLTGLDLTGQDDRVASVLMGMARADTAPASARLADAVIDGLRSTNAAVNSRPRREGRLAVLNAADFPSILLEVGFLSNATDRTTLSTADGRAPIVAGLTTALQDWAATEAALAGLKRQ
ncbi:N-acetylmuramoyl-L-alanine amidase [Loktanella fryxellensis]|uniref:N-acetylmuramoyl-L-alanine amidase n=1 Tax=Loktanella fryxellensis TaxID=245187 RepID=A0A1H7YQC0_9RHOB|nr:N-acetylmuramoyl-L-alanine amidase [Loktanella fryxellensis]SEM48442.1 N-acetylmuramoyl-L-alanine amidase [Loktanella fryxellensis]